MTSEAESPDIPASAGGREPAAGAAPPETIVPRPEPARRFVPLRNEISTWEAVAWGAFCLAACAAVWWLLTKGEPEERIFAPSVLPSPAETFASFPELWFDRALTRNTYASLRRVVLGFGLAALVGVPAGVLCGCFRRFNALLAPLVVGGRNIPVAALIPVTFSLVGIDEFQKVMFIFIACVAFIVMDTANAIGEISSRYVDTAYTLGASRRQIILKVLVPLAMPAVCSSLRLLFGLAFGYIMLAELVKAGGEMGGLGDIINISQRRGQQTHILLVLMIIPLVALAIDRILYRLQQQLFPYQYGGDGLLHHSLRAVLRVWEDLMGLFRRPAALPGAGPDTAAGPPK